MARRRRLFTARRIKSWGRLFSKPRAKRGTRSRKAKGGRFFSQSAAERKKEDKYLRSVMSDILFGPFKLVGRLLRKSGRRRRK